MTHVPRQQYLISGSRFHATRFHASHFHANRCAAAFTIAAAAMATTFPATANLLTGPPSTLPGPPSGIFGGFNNLTNFSQVELAIAQDGVDFIGVEEFSVGDNGSPTSLSAGRTYGDTAEFSDVDSGFFGVTGQGFASSIAGTLRASASIQVTENSVTDEGFSTPLLNNSGEDTPGGIPTAADFSAFAGFTDQLQFGGTASGYNSRYLIRVTGEITAPAAFAVLTIQQGDGSAQTFFFDEVGTFNQTIATDTFVGSGLQTFSADVQVTASVSPEFDFEGDSTAAVFNNTFEIIGLEVRDADTGELAPTGIVETSNGFAVPITVVPEPSAAVALALAGLALVGRRRRA